ncbi:hypothetical protein V2J09_011054 [Rumex salicifolius]
MEISSSAIHVHGTFYTNLSLPSSLRFPLFLPSNSLRRLASLPSRASISTRRLFLVAPRSLSDDAAAVGLAMDPIEAYRPPAKADPFFAVQQKAMEVVNDLKGTSLFLVGMNSPMKEKIGKVIAEVLRYYYFDSDGLVEEAGGYDSSGKSFRERDEDGFRESELLSKLTAVYQENNGGYATADACISLLKVASNMDYDEYHHVTAEDMALEVLKEIEKLTRVKKMMEEAGKPF